MRPSVKKSGSLCGAEIGVDLARDLDDATFREIERAFHENVVVVFREQQLSNQRHVEFSSRFGELEIHIVKKYLLPEFPEILLISNIRNDEAGLEYGVSSQEDTRPQAPQRDDSSSRRSRYAAPYLRCPLSSLATSPSASIPTHPHSPFASSHELT